MVRIKEKNSGLKDELIACLKGFDQSPLKNKLANVISALKQTDQPIYDNEKLNTFLRKELCAKIPELNPNNPQFIELLDAPGSLSSNPLIKFVNFCLKLKYKPAPEPEPSKSSFKRTSNS